MYNCYMEVIKYSFDQISDISRSLASTAKKHNLGINVWTVNNKRAIKWCKDKGVDGVITDLKVNNV